MHARLPICVLAALLAVSRTPLAAQDKQKICQDVQHHVMTVGTWASYNWTGGRSDGSKIRVAVVGKEMRAGTALYWYEMMMQNPKRAKDNTILQMLVPSLMYDPNAIRGFVMKSGDQPAMRIPEQMIRMMAANLGSNMGTDIARACDNMDLVGWEQVTVPAGSFRALHLRQASSGTEAWIQPSLGFPMVKAVLKDNGTMELAGQGTGAKSSITETPREMSFPGAPPR
ncbi:MAG: hypothetical protein ABR537_01850 [Gemmatimonadales bacterium]